MFKRLKGPIVIAVLATLSGCTTAGPFVTSLSSDGGGGLTVEKCMVHMNAFMGVLSNSDCTSQNIRLSQTDANRQNR